jgi:hypothetical protein
VTGLQKIRAWVLGGAVLVLLSAGCVYLLWETRQSAGPDNIVLDAAFVRQGRGGMVRRQVMDHVPLAELPWRAVKPGSAPAMLRMAAVPNMPPRRDWRDPVPATVNLAQNPWGRDVDRPEPAAISIARLPSNYLVEIKIKNRK